MPLLVKLPDGAHAGKTVNGQVRTTDILPTLLDFSNAETAAHFDGDSLRSYLEDTETSGRTAFGETDYPLRFGWAPLRSVRNDHQKFIEAPRPEFYDLGADPGETLNRYAPWAPEVQKAREILADLRKRQPANAPTSATVGERTLAELRALGYLGAADAGSTTTVPEPSLLPDPKDHIEEQNLLHTAMLAADDNRPAAARQALTQVLARNPKSLNALGQLGELEFQAGDFAKAADHLRSAQQLGANDPVLNLYLGQALAKAGETASACEALERSLKASPGQVPARVLLGNLYLNQKNYQAAADQFEAVLLLDPDNADAKKGLAAAKAARQ